jgi:hypothetical protein
VQHHGGHCAVNATAHGYQNLSELAHKNRVYLKMIDLFALEDWRFQQSCVQNYKMQRLLVHFK